MPILHINLELPFKVAYETNYWLRVIRDASLLPKNRMGELIAESEQIKKILTASVKTAQANQRIPG